VRAILLFRLDALSVKDIESLNDTSLVTSLTWKMINELESAITE